jgi:hypothetical protein
MILLPLMTTWILGTQAISSVRGTPELRMRNRACVNIANTLRRVVGNITDESVAARLESLATSYEHRADAYAVSNNDRRRRTAHADGGEDL